MKKNLLVLYVHSASRLSHLKKIRELNNKYIITILHANVKADNYIEKFCQRAVKVSSENSSNNFQDILRKLGPDYKPDGIINVSEPFLPIQHKLCKYFNVIGPSSEAVEVGRNKFNMRNFLKNLHIPVPGFVKINEESIDLADQLAFPVIVKPLVGSGSSLVKRFETFAELKQSYRGLSDNASSLFKMDSQYNETFNGNYPLIVEEIIGGEVLFNTQLPFTVGEISVESVYAKGKVEVLAIHDKPLPNNGPYFEEVCFSTPTRIPIAFQKQAKEYVTKIHEALGEGTFVLHTEFRTLRNGLRLIEFGVRMGGSAIYNSLLASTGIDFIDVQADIALRQDVSIPSYTAKPTLTLLIFPELEGEIKSIHGESLFVSDASYVEHQIYDDSGDYAWRAPMATRSTMHLILQDKTFFDVERAAIQLNSMIKIETT